MSDINSEIATLIASVRKGSVIAAAGCGKTEEIAHATKVASGRRLILTHTLAGVDVLRQRLKKHGVSANRYHLETIAGWCLRYAVSFPIRSGLMLREPRTNADWRVVYQAAATLVESGAVDNVLAASYTGIFVDEYQDCGADQHSVVVALATRLPICVFGDHLQAVFDFKNHAPVDWKRDVFSVFPQAARLSYPWRWHKAENPDLARWLETVRTTLDEGHALDFRASPACVRWDQLPDSEGSRRSKIVATCLSAMHLDGRLIVIADPTNLEGRAQLARNLAKQGFSNVEPLDCKTLFASAKAIDTAENGCRLRAALDFLSKCMTGIGRSAFEVAVASRKTGGKRGTTQFGRLIDLGIALELPDGQRHLLDFFEELERRADTHVFRREMYSAMRSALRTRLSGQSENLVDALWLVQNRIRHAGRVIAHRSVGSTLLVKGLEFEHAIIIHSPSMNRCDWYVALTRATQSITVLSPQKRFKLAD